MQRFIKGSSQGLLGTCMHYSVFSRIAFNNKRFDHNTAYNPLFSPAQSNANNDTKNASSNSSQDSNSTPLQYNQFSSAEFDENVTPIMSSHPLDPYLDSLYREPRMLDCVLVRHGESEGNIAYNKSWQGDHSLYSGAFLKRHSSLWRLTDRGREQAMHAGEWIKNNMPAISPLLPQSTSNQSLLSNNSQQNTLFHRYYVSEYIRAMETAGLMNMPGSRWFVEVQLRERDWGQFDIMSQKERVVRFSEETKRRDRDSLFYAPPGGESLVHVLSRVDGILNNFNRQAANKRCLIVCHGEVMWAFRLRFERLSQLTYREMEAAPTSVEKIHNAQILHYTRQNPYTGEISPIFKWKRSICPWDLTRSRNVWEEIMRVQHTNESLLQHVNRVKRIYAHDNPFHKPTMDEQQSRENKKTGTVVNAIAPQSPLMQNIKPDSEEKPQTKPNLSEGRALSRKSSKTEAESAEEIVVSNAAQSPAINSTSKLEIQPLNTEPRDSTTTENHSTPPTTNVAHNLSHDLLNHSNSNDSASAFVQGARQIPSLLSAGSVVTNPFLKTHPSVLVLTKTPRYEHEKQSLGLRGEDLHSELSRLGFVSDRLVQSYVRHMEGLSQLTLALQSHGMKVTVKQVDQCRAEDLKGIDLVISAGGDGTMLKSASLLGINTGSASSEGESSTLSTANIPLIGVNTDPQHSSGFLCAFSVEGPHTCERVLEHIHRGHFVWKTKTRLSVELIDKLGQSTVIPQFALNDILIAEKDPGRPFVYELTVDDQASEIQRSSGVLISTGTGSTAWMSSAAAIHADQVQRILADVGLKTSAAEAKHIAERVNLDMVFDSESDELEYYVREQLLTQVNSSKGKYHYRHGFGKKLMIRSLGWNANMFFDGLSTYTLPKGTIAQINIGNKTHSKLTVLSLAGTGGEPFSRQ
jgi:broad specificity phosphatase PhoE/NAD kinase